MVHTGIGRFVCCVVAAMWGALAASSAHAAITQITHGTTTINMDFVNVGNASNAADNTGYGSVGYNYRIGTYEVTAAQWAAVIAADSSVGNVGSWSGLQPTAGTSWNEAAKFCNWLTTGHYDQGYYTISSGGVATENALSHDAYAAAYGTTYFIPTENEWYKAAYYDPNGKVYYDYPTGSDAVPDGIDSIGDTVLDAVFADGYYRDHPNDVTNAGIASPYGTIGQGGNVWEWNEALIDSSRGVRGGSWDYDFYGLLASTRDFPLSPSFENYSLGFRVASSGGETVSEAAPEPASIAVWLGIGGIALVWRRRRR